MNALQNWRTEAKALPGPLAHHVREPSAMPTAHRLFRTISERQTRFITLLGGAAAVWPLAARAQQGGKRYIVSLLSAGGGGVQAALNSAFVDGLREWGWVEGKNVVFENRNAEDRLERLSELAADLVRLKVDVIAAGPGGNVPGMSLMAPDLGAKRLELLKELLPRLTRVAVLWNAANPYSALVFQETQAGGRTLGIEVQSLDVGGPEDFDATFEAARRLRLAATEALFDGFCERLVAAGVPIARGFLSIAGLHPLRRAYSLTWNDGRIVEVTNFGHATMATALWQTSPFRHMLETKTRRLHRRLVGDDAVLDSEVLREFRDAGAMQG
jgi:putative ABC transport system substrate-binding protein